MHSDGSIACFDWGRERFISEAKTLADIHHDGVVRVRDFFLENGTAYLIMDFEDSEPLSRRLSTENILPEKMLRGLVLQLLDALDAVHQKGYLHRDITPENLYVRARDNKLILVDLGAARQAVSGSSQPVTSVLTPGYAPREQYETAGKQHGPWTDLYAVGAVLYRCVTGKTPIEATQRVLNDPLPPAVAVGAENYEQNFLQVIDKALAVRPEERFQDVVQFRQALTESSSGTAHSGVMTTVPTTLVNSTGRIAGTNGSPQIGLTVAGVLVILGIISAVFLWIRSFASLTVEVSPTDAQIKIVDLGRHYRPNIKIAPGDYVIAVKREGFKSHRQKYSLQPGSQIIAVELQTPYSGTSVGM